MKKGQYELIQCQICGKYFPEHDTQTTCNKCFDTSYDKRKFYVYVLRKPNGEPFYVGKGKIQRQGIPRMYQHEYEAKHTNQKSHKLNTIRKILKSGKQVQYEIVARFENELDALAYEKDLILKYGKRIDKTGTLTNKKNGFLPIPLDPGVFDTPNNRKYLARIGNKYSPEMLFRVIIYIGDVCRTFTNETNDIRSIRKYVKENAYFLERYENFRELIRSKEEDPLKVYRWFLKILFKISDENRKQKDMESANFWMCLRDAIIMMVRFTQFEKKIFKKHNDSFIMVKYFAFQAAYSSLKDREMGIVHNVGVTPCR